MQQLFLECNYWDIVHWIEQCPFMWSLCTTWDNKFSDRQGVRWEGARRKMGEGRVWNQRSFRPKHWLLQALRKLWKTHVNLPLKYEAGLIYVIEYSEYLRYIAKVASLLFTWVCYEHLELPQILLTSLSGSHKKIIPSYSNHISLDNSCFIALYIASGLCIYLFTVNLKLYHT